MRLACLAVVFIMASTAVLRGAEATNEVFTASPQRRAELLAKVRARDKEKAAIKAKGPVVTIVDNGQPVAVIVADGADLKSGQLLQEWVKLMSGAELPVTNQPAAKGVNLYVGQSAVDAGLKLDDIKSRSREGLRVKCDGKNVFIAGQNDTATFRAVGRFLEEEFGCRFFDYTKAGRVYPESKTLTVLAAEFSEAPGFMYRTVWGAEGAFGNYAGYSGAGAWRYWNGEGGVGIPMSHSWGGVVPESEFEKHPEWFRMDENGQRVKGPWPNLGHPEVRKRFIQWAVTSSSNGLKAVSFSPPDDHREDFSPEAKRYDNLDVIDPTSGRVSMTDRFMGLVNEAAKELLRLNPNAPLSGFYAYSDYTLPPTRPELQKLAPNICVWIAPIRYTRFHPIGHPASSSAQELKKVIDGWSERAASMGLRTYNYNLADLQVPFSKISTWAHDLPYLYKRGFVGANFESFDEWEIYGPHTYLQMRLAYDPGLDPWEIMADYWDKSYGPAAEVMEKYWLDIDAAFITLRTDTGSTHSHHRVYTPERLAALDALLKEAEGLVKGRATLEGRVALARRGLTRAQYWRKWYDAVNRGDIDGTSKIFDEWSQFVDASIKMRHANKYANTYLQRFIGNNTWSAWLHLHPKDTNAAPAKLVGVLPDEWKTATRDEIDKSGVKGSPFDEKYDDSNWKTIKTFTDTRNAQGLPEYFGEMWYRVTYKAPKLSPKALLHFQKADRKVTVYINGKQVNAEEAEAFRGVGIDISGHLKPGAENQITVMVRHIPLPEMYLGGLVGPVYLLEKSE
jgi:hypothetical protein